MSPDEASARETRGPIAWMVRHGVAANLLMLFILVAGLVSLAGVVREAFPVLRTSSVEVAVSYPGATPEEIEEAVVRRVEEQVQSLTGVRDVTSVASPGSASVMVEFVTGTDMREARSDVETAVAAIPSLPAAVERPVVRRVTNRPSVIRLVVHGGVSGRALKAIAQDVEDRLAGLPGVSYVETSGSPPDEISIEVPRRRLQALGIGLDDIAEIVRAGALDLSAGRVETRETGILVRTTGRRYTQQDFERIVVLAEQDGAALRLGDIAEVRDGFRDTDLIVRHDGEPAAFVEVYRNAGEEVLAVARAVEEHVEAAIRPSLPPGVGITIWNNDADVYEERRDVLVGNGWLGLLLVVVSLTLFLQIRLALWVALGIAVAVTGTAVTMLLVGVSINAFSMFAIVITVGLVVDDAVVVAESIHSERRRGLSGPSAAVRGTRRVLTPVTFGVLTTMAVFAPLLFIPGFQGDIIRPTAIILISVLTFSLIDAMLILPSHLSHLPPPGERPKNPVERFFGAVESGVDGALQAFVRGPLDRAVRFAVRQPEPVVAGSVAAFVLAVALIPAGRIGVILDQPVESDIVTARLEMPPGTPARRTDEAALHLEAAGRRAAEGLRPQSDDAPPLLVGVNTTVGMEARQELGGFFLSPDLNPPSHIATVQFKLRPAAERTVRASAFQAAWREEAGELPGARGVAFTSNLIDLGRPIHAELSHPDSDRLDALAREVEERLRNVDGVFDVRSDRSNVVQEIRLTLRPETRTLGVTVDGLARQARSAFFGAEAVRVQRGREDVRAYVRLPPGERDTLADLEAYRVRTPSGADLPLHQAARLRLEEVPALISRRNGRRIVTVTADVDSQVVTGEDARAFLETRIIPDLRDRYPELEYAFGGRGQEATEAFDAVGRMFVLALFLIYALLAIPLGSYVRPLVVMAVVPLGVTGAILGHLVMGMDLSFMSVMGILGLSGIVVNDSLVMVDFISKRIGNGAPPATAIVAGARERFRPIFLTSATTFLALAPLTFESGVQAQVLVPAAISMSFGILFATVLLMMFVPALAALYYGARDPLSAGVGQEVVT